ncbi:MAG: hypothetical protein SVG88_01790 [Halobacteriales archaeon]|nr:hypothetical protein [Halobacteriales archaeon]
MTSFDNRSLGRIARIVGTFLAGAVGTIVFTLVFLWLAQPLQHPIYDGLYLLVGPWTATTTATILSFTLSSLLAISVPTLAVIYRRGHADALQPLVIGLLAVLGAASVVFLIAAVLGVISLLTAVIVASLFIATVPFVLRHLDLWPDGAVVFSGGVPVLILSLLLLGFGLGWGGGYDIVATEIPATAVDGNAGADFATVPALRDALLASNDGNDFAYCETDGGQRTCRLSLRGYDQEAKAARFLDRHGVRCPFLNAPGAADSGNNQSFVAEHNGTYYRVSCIAYGD